MSLIICPECKNKISQYAELCPKCGFPVQQYIQKYKLCDFQKTFICPKCGNYELYFDFDPDAPRHIVCEFCNTPFIQTNLSTKEFEAQSLEEWRKGNKYFEIDVAKKYGNGQFDEEAYQIREQILAQRKTEERQQQKEVQKAMPKCPTCGSTNIEKISVGKKIGGSFLFGVFSSDVRNTMHCKDCGAKW